MLANIRRSALFIFVLVAMILPLATAMAQNTTPGRNNILFTQQD